MARMQVGQLNRNCNFRMKKGGGRTSRIRRRKLFRCSVSRGVNESYKPEFIELKKWLKDRKFEDTNLIPACFPGTGRGLMSKTSLRPLFSEAVESIFSYRALLWAWCTVNTRAVYVKHRQRQCFSTEPNTYALAPYLDLLNHSPEVQVKGAFNEETRCYEIRTASNCRKHEEVFICYGPHDNQRLLLEYGFVSIHNPHACVYVSEDILVKYLPTTDKQMNKKISILKDHDFIENLTFGWDGPSWRLLTALKLLCLEAEELVLVRVGMAQQQGQALLFPAATGKDALGGRSAGQHHSLPSSLLCLQGHLWKSGECVSVFKMQGLCEAFGRASGSTRGGGFAWPALSQSQKQSGV
ncbi:SET domain-containing protein 4 isoform X8 [Canis aureus]